MSSPAPGVVTCYRHPGREANIRCQRCDRPICTDCMRDAAVGFQCPSCVSEGARTTRQDNGPYGGRRSRNPMATTFALMAVNIGVWIAIVATGWQSSRLIFRLALSPTGTCESIGSAGSYYPALDTAARCALERDGRWVPGVFDGAYWQLITNAFMHVEWWHIGVNMLSLFLLGPSIERILGRARFLATYAVGGLAASALVYWFAPVGGYTLGASGAIFGLMGATLVLAIKLRGNVQSVLITLAINAYITFSVPNLSWQGHLGGFLGGAAVTAILVYAPRGPRRATVQWLAIGGVVALLALAVVARSAVLA